ncbi:cysteine proteinase aalp [Stylonychia lemnae]|uniref:Cysteine proteinase aalp n=1 Tax=Stylonychia lemnae TaxID=5949 RepID=A0A078A0L4_STYLE|nr:cysteine proteinase aalp [Stylonychia lemnae]|eukprot:CDW75397.1 cysteine proteinase aalp [Stylonychia lemnae]
MRGSKLAAILLIATTSVYANVNEELQKMLNANQRLDVDVLYEQWLKEFDGVRPSKRLDARGVNQFRKGIFNSKVMNIISHNLDKTKTFKKGLNQLSDLTAEEVYRYYNLKAQAEQVCSATSSAAKDLSQALKSTPEAYDWREHNGVTPVKDQGQCGSCWTFSTVGAVEAHYLIKYHQFRNLSEQQLVDCAQNFDNHGCNGGLPSHAFEYIKDNGGLSTEQNYPYHGVDQTCNIPSGTQVVGVVGGSVNLTTSEDDLKVAIYEHGPVSIAFQVVDDFMDYHSGVYASQVCGNGPMDVNHAVLAVGYGTEKVSGVDIDYWIVKNSWSASWGDQGFFKIQRGVNMCGLNNCNSYPQDVLNLSSAKEFLQ